jgi:hypothetical protein
LPPHHAQQISLHAHGIATIEGKQPTSSSSSIISTNNSALQPSPVLPLGMDGQMDEQIDGQMNGWMDSK